MKKYKSTIMALWAVMACTSFMACSENEDSCSTSDLIQLTNRIYPAARVTALDRQSTRIAEGQQVGVTIEGAQRPHTNVAWTVGSDGQMVNSGDALYWTNSDISVVAYHPYQADWSTDAEMSFSVATDQSDDESYLNSDLLWVSTTASKSEDPVSLMFSHKLAKVNVTLQSDSQSDLSDAVISICRTNITTNFNPVTGELSAPALTDVEDIKAGTTTSTAYTASAIVVPQTVASGTQFIKVELDNTIYYYTLSADKELVGGHAYHYTLKLKEKVNLSLVSYNISDWVSEEIAADADEHSIKMTVTLEEAGTLNQYLTSANKYEVSELKIIGNINGTDVKLIREYAACNGAGKPTEETGALVVLDLSEANIVAGGDTYTDYHGNQYSTEDNVVTESMFEYTNFKTVILPDNITKIGRSAFEVLMNMEHFTIPNSVTVLESYAFNTCSNLKEIIIPESVEKIGTSAFSDCDGLTSVTIPGKVTTIATYTFEFCSNLASVYLPENLQTISAMAFCFCPSITEIHCKATTPPTLSSDAFSTDVYTSATLYVPVGTKSSYQAATSWSSFTNIVEE